MFEGWVGSFYHTEPCSMLTMKSRRENQLVGILIPNEVVNWFLLLIIGEWMLDRALSDPGGPRFAVPKCLSSNTSSPRVVVVCLLKVEFTS